MLLFFLCFITISPIFFIILEYVMTFAQLSGLLGSPGCGIDLCDDSRDVEEGDCFVAVSGSRFDGHDFISQAVANGAAYIVCEKRADCANAEMVIVDSSAAALGLLAQAALGNPSSKLTNLAVTGTNGKTTVGYLAGSVIRTAGQKCGLIGTIVYDTTTETADASLTTPGALEIAELARKMVDENARFMVIEASSHSLSQHRLSGIKFTAAAFTNLTGDHLDYHGTREDYLAAKTRLFTQLPADGTAILNGQSPAAEKIARQIKTRILWYAVDAEADITGRIESMNISGTVYTLGFGGQEVCVKTSLTGRHNISNHLAAAGLCIAAGFDLPAIGRGLSALKSVPGRLEAVDCGQEFAVLVDYAHTDDALKNVLNTLKPLCKGKLIVVFGCGGDRDKTKRPRMAKVAEDLADRIIVTSDNPRTERAEEIVNDIIAGFVEPDADAIVIKPDRRKAIESAVKTAGADDIVLIAGKGHETYQLIGNTKYDFNDAEIVREFLGKNR